MSRRTRQRQGRDFPPFSIHEYLKNDGRVADVKHIVPDDLPGDDGRPKQSVHETLERLRAESGQNAEPVDGHEPEPERVVRERRL